MTRWSRNKHPWPATSHQFTRADFSYKAGSMYLDNTLLQEIKKLSTQKHSQNVPCRLTEHATFDKLHSCWYTWNQCLGGFGICPAHSVKLTQPCMTWDDFNPMQEQRLQIWGLLKLILRINFPSLLQSPNPGRPRGGLLIRQRNTHWLNPQLSISVTLQEGKKLKHLIWSCYPQLITFHVKCGNPTALSSCFADVHSVPEQRKQGPWP